MKWLIYVLLTLGLLMILGTTNAQKLNQEEIADLQNVREEQKMTFDLYQEFFTLYDHYIFDLIAASEAQQMQQVKNIMGVYRISDPIAETEMLRGNYSNSSVQQHYDHFYAMGIQSLNDALKASAQLEEQDINTTRKYLRRTDNPLIRRTYEHLIRASEKNLQSFVRNLEMAGQDYHATVLTEGELEEILNKERRTLKAEIHR